MPAISGRKICRQFPVGRNAGDFGLKKMPAKSDRNKMLANSGRKKIPASSGRKKRPVFSGGDKIAGKPAIAGELTGLTITPFTVILFQNGG